MARIPRRTPRRTPIRRPGRNPLLPPRPTHRRDMTPMQRMIHTASIIGPRRGPGSARDPSVMRQIRQQRALREIERGMQGMTLGRRQADVDEITGRMQNLRLPQQRRDRHRSITEFEIFPLGRRSSHKSHRFGRRMSYRGRRMSYKRRRVSHRGRRMSRRYSRRYSRRC